MMEVDLGKGRPLEGRTVVVTRPRAQADEFAAALENYGARVVLCPTIEIVPLENYDALDEAMNNLYGYDWLIFTSVNGVDYFLRRFRAQGHEISELDDLRICAIGDATAERLAEASVHVDVVPAEFKAEGIFAALVEYLGGVEVMSGLNFLIPRAAAARDYLPRALEDAGGRADVVPVYRTVRPQSTERAQLAALLAGGGIDCLTFTSSSTVTNFAQLFDTIDLGALLAGVTVACIGDVTAQTAAEHNLRCAIQPPEFTTPALARAIADYYRRK